MSNKQKEATRKENLETQRQDRKRELWELTDEEAAEEARLLEDELRAADRAHARAYAEMHVFKRLQELETERSCGPEPWELTEEERALEAVRLEQRRREADREAAPLLYEMLALKDARRWS